MATQNNFSVKHGLTINTTEVFDSTGTLLGPSALTISESFDHANAAFDYANTLTSGAGVSSAFDKANSAYDLAQSSYAQANTDYDLAQSAFDAANTAYGAIPSLSGYATESYVGTAITNLVNGAPTTLDTLKEIADALGNDANLSSTLTTLIGSAYGQANTSTNLAQSAFDAANTAYGAIPSLVGYATETYVTDHSQPAYDQANTAQSTAQAAFDKANTSTAGALTNGSHSLTLESDGVLSLSTSASIYSNTYTFGSTSPVDVDVFALSDYSAVKYLIQATLGTEIHSTEVTLMHNGTDIYVSEYATMFTTNLISVSASIGSGNASLSITPTSSGVIIDFARTSLMSRFSGGGGGGGGYLAEFTKGVDYDASTSNLMYFGPIQWSNPPTWNAAYAGKTIEFTLGSGTYTAIVQSSDLYNLTTPTTIPVFTNEVPLSARILA